MLNTPFSPWPAFTAEEADVIREVLLSGKVNYWTGSQCREFEYEFSEWAGLSHAIALMNGTVALDIALKVLGIGPGDEVVVTPRTFIASVSCVVNAGATPIFADVDNNTGNITADTIVSVLTQRTKAIICVHLAGWPCDMDPIMDLSREHNLFVIEDCAQSHGAWYKGRSVGSIGHIGTWSFCQDKIMTTGGEGGMVTTNDDALWRAMWAYKDHGKSYEAVYEREHPPGFRWLHESFGTNWRMTEMQAAIGRIQLRRMREWSDQRQKNADKLRVALGSFTRKDGVIRLPDFGGMDECRITKDKPPCASQYIHANYKFYAYVRPENLKPGWTRDRIIEAIKAEDIPCSQGSCSEVYLEKAFDNTGIRPAKRLPVAKGLGETSLMFLIHPTLTKAEMNKTATVIKQVLKQASA